MNKSLFVDFKVDVADLKLDTNEKLFLQMMNPSKKENAKDKTQ